MLRCAKSRLRFRSRAWVGACINSFASSLASKAGTHLDHAPFDILKVSASEASRIHGNTGASEPQIRRRSAHDNSSSRAKISVRIASRQDVDADLRFNEVKALACSVHDAKSHLVSGDAQVSGLAALVPNAKALNSDDDLRGSETIASVCESQSPHLSWKTLLKQADEEAQIKLADLKKLELLELEEFSPSDARKLLNSRAVRVCSVEQITTALQELKKCFPCAKLVRDIVIRSSNVLVQPAEVVQQKLKLLRDFQVEEKVVSMLCGRAGVLILSMESLQERLAFFDDFGLTVAARNRVFGKAPLILRCGLEKAIKPPLQFLKSKGLTEECILKIVERSPHIFYMSYNTLIKKYEYIRQVGFFEDRFPTVLFARSLSIKILEEHRLTLKALGFTDDDISSMVNLQPGILGLSSKATSCKVDFLINKQHRKLAEIVRFPHCLMYSLQTRMLPRFYVLNVLAPARVFSLSSMLCSSDSALAKRLGKAIDVENGQEVVMSKLKEAKGKLLSLQQISSKDVL